MLSSISKNHPNEFYCRECKFYYPFTLKEEISAHYLSHIQFLEVLIKDLDFKIVLEEDNDVG